MSTAPAHLRRNPAPADEVLPFLIVQTGTTLPALRRRRGDFAHWFRVGMRLPARDVATVRVDLGDTLPDPSRYAGIVVSGSGAMVTQKQPWSEATAAWLAPIVADAIVPVLGVCYGHQLLAHALGGRVDYNPRGREIGRRFVSSLPAADDDVLFRPLRDGFHAQLTHQQSVLDMPAGAVVLAHSDLDPHQAARFGARAWGVQFHPEFSAHAITGYVRGRAEALRAEGIDDRLLLREAGPAAAARRLLQRFARLTREGRI
jgi:GMP synthase (glutamine-hydrolysing)